jgi:hypothetical protein
MAGGERCSSWACRHGARWRLCVCSTRARRCRIIPHEYQSRRPAMLHMIIEYFDVGAGNRADWR